MSSPAWMPFYGADYLRDTGHLTTVEHGAYLLLIIHYWFNGGLPDDEKKLARIARMRGGEWEECRDTLADLFEDGWRHKRIEAELTHASVVIEKRSKAAKAMHDRRTSNADADASAEQMQDTPSNANAVHMHGPSPSPSPSPKESKKETKANALVSAKRKPRPEFPVDLAEHPEIVRVALEEGLSETERIRQVEMCRDHFAGKGERKADWVATARNWIRNSPRFNRGGSNVKRPSAINAAFDKLNGFIAREAQGVERDAGSGDVEARGSEGAFAFGGLP